MDKRPAEGWSNPYGDTKAYVSHEVFSDPPPAPEGYENRFIARHGDYVRWYYRPAREA